MSSLALHHGSERVRPCAAREPVVVPAFLGEGYSLYDAKRSAFVLSFLGHTLALALLLTTSRYLVAHHREIHQQAVGLVTDISSYLPSPPASKAGGGGGGGERDKLAASKGSLPRLSRQQLAPPAIIVRNETPKMPVEPTVVVPPQINLPQGSALGDPLSAVLGPPSNGIGSGGGIGSGSGGGVGSGRGPGVGPGWGGGIGGGAYRIGGGVTAPHIIYAPEPEFSEEARKAKYQGTVVLWLVVGADGRAHDIHIYRSLGMGLDEKAIEAIHQWRFQPGRKDGVPVAVEVNVEISFRLF